LTSVVLCFSIAIAITSVSAGSEDAATIVLQKLDQAERLVNEGRLQDALAALEVLDVPPTMPLERARKHHDCGVILIQTGRSDDAVEHLLGSLKNDPTNAPAAYLLAVLAADKGRVDEAKAMLDIALAIRRDYEPAQRLQRKLANHPLPTGHPAEP